MSTGGALESLPTEVASALTTAMVSDALDASGARGFVLDAQIVPQSGTRFIGRAATAQFEPSHEDGPSPYDAAIDFIDGLLPGAVPLIATGGDARTAYWGELFSAAARGRGAVGTVCDGPVRDTAAIAALGYPVFAPSARPLDFRARMKLVATGVPVTCAGVSVSPGDVVIADADGVVVIPARYEAEVLAVAARRAQAERTVLGELLNGAGLREVWNRWGVL